MIAILTNDGSMQIARALSGGELFLVYGAAMINGQIDDRYKAATFPFTIGRDASGKEISVTFDNQIYPIETIAPCTGILPVKVAEDETSAVAVDFDFNTQLIDDIGNSLNLEYQTVLMLGRRYRKYSYVEYGTTYHYGDHVWLGNNVNLDTAYVCVADSYTYAVGAQPPNVDTAHWMAVPVDNLLRHPADPEYYSDPEYDSLVMHVTSYDDTMVMGNGIEWEYKVRVFLDNLTQDRLDTIAKFAQGTEANGSLILSFMAEISENFRALRDMFTTSGS